ncbi:MAG: SET domain-containing protein [Anaerolineales bacterium]|nr:SET domain-containing protein [Anaerolineales bacterium]MCW5854644.1 SET domain-containing protein [Anaerolineales bacterium]
MTDIQKQSATNSWLSDKLEIRTDETIEGRGMFALRPIQRGERVAVWGGDVVTRAFFEALQPHQQSQSAQVEEDLYLVSSKPGSGDFINHSCDPNAGLEGQIVIVALRDIVPGEEVTIDYAMCDGDPRDWFDCLCGSAACRGRVTGNDWKLPQLQQRYAGRFSPFLQKRIQAQKEG